jgi:hypothetical protein
MNLAWAVDAAITLMLLEALALALWRRAAWTHAWPNVLAGLGLGGALHFGLSQPLHPAVLPCLAASGTAWAVDVWRRWKR